MITKLSTDKSIHSLHDTINKNLVIVIQFVDLIDF